MDSNIKIRIILPEEKAAALDLVWRVFLKYEAPQYPEEGVRFFKEYLDNDEATSVLDIYGAFMGARVVGVLAMRSGGTHVSLFFVDEEFHRRGIGKALFEYMIKSSSPDFVTVHAAPYAVEVYRRLGFSPAGGEVVEDGLIYTPMEMKNILINDSDISQQKKS
ncbi:MAG: GNAT family N-acetyltransferase [Oscillospiraceae bacterium]